MSSDTYRCCNTYMRPLPKNGRFICMACLRIFIAHPKDRSTEGWDDGLLAKLIGPPPPPTPELKIIPWELDPDGACICHRTNSICYMCPSTPCQHTSCRGARYKRYVRTLKRTKITL